MLMLPHRTSLRILVYIVIGFSGLSQAGGQDRPQIPFGDPQAFLDRLFGGNREQDRKRIEAMTINPQEEARIGAGASDYFLRMLKQRGQKVTNRGPDVEYLQALIARVQPKMQNAGRYRTIRVYVVDSPEPNARSFPGGVLVFFRGMLELAENEAALTAVIGHELSHLDRQHQLYDAKRLKLMEKSFSATNGFSPRDFFQNGSLMMRSFSRPFRPEEEALADRDGATWAFELGYDPRELAQMFRRWENRKRDPKGGLPGFLRSHPVSREREASVLKLYESLQAKRPRRNLIVGRDNLRTRKASSTVRLAK